VEHRAVVLLCSIQLSFPGRMDFLSRARVDLSIDCRPSRVDARVIDCPSRGKDCPDNKTLSLKESELDAAASARGHDWAAGWSLGIEAFTGAMADETSARCPSKPA
jgi:hypothetical protein